MNASMPQSGAPSTDDAAPGEAYARAGEGATLIDVRDAAEVAAGLPERALHVPLCELERRIERLVPDRTQHVLLICAGGRRSAEGAARLRALGYARVVSVAGGFQRWRADGLPVARAPGLADDLDVERYARQLTLPEVGLDGQRRLRDARVVLVGAGGLGSPAALYLAAAGVGHLALVDDDRVERSNLHRQVLHGDTDVGRPKIESGAARVAALNPSVHVERVQARLTAANARTLLEGAHVIIDGADNFATRYAVSDACVALGIPDVHGSVFRFEGQVTVLWPAAPERGPCYRCLYPEPPPPELAPSCGEAGVLGVVPGVIGLLQAAEALKLILRIGSPLVGRMLQYDALRGRFDEFDVPRDPGCPVCSHPAHG
jgi:molybdopterin/thiamine biosynthesis adenylyltransferase/rhodanese-related sulfurtransferase